MEFTEIYGDIENCDLCGEEFERHHRDFNFEMNLRIEYMREVLNQTQKDQTLAHSILHSRNGSISRKIDGMHNLHAKKDSLMHKHITTLNSPLNRRPSRMLGTKDHMTPMNKLIENLDNPMVSNNVRIQINLQEDGTTAKKQEQLAVGGDQHRIKSKFESAQRWHTSKTGAGIQRKKKLNAETIKSIVPEG